MWGDSSYIWLNRPFNYLNAYFSCEQKTDESMLSKNLDESSDLTGSPIIPFRPGIYFFLVELLIKLFCSSGG